MGMYTDLPRNEEIALYSIRGQCAAIWAEIKPLPKYRQQNVAKMLRAIINESAGVLNAHGDDFALLAEDADPLTQFPC
jgi:hypothetical protein